MLQRLIAAVLGVLGLAAIALGVASATVWRADDTLTARAQGADGSTLVTTAPGVLELVDAPVTVRVTGEDGTKVVVAVGRDTDVAGWVGPDPHTVVTGLSDWHTLATDDVEGAAADPAATPAPAEGAPADAAVPTTPAPDPDGSDLWVLQSAGEGSAELTWTPQDGRWTALAASVGEGASAPVVELSWPQTVTTPWLVPGVVGGAVLLLLGLLLALRLWRAERSGAGGWQPVATGATPVVPDRSAATDDTSTVVLSRRQIREATATAPAAGTASRPTPTVASRLRNLATGETPAVSALPHAGGSTAMPRPAQDDAVADPGPGSADASGPAAGGAATAAAGGATTAAGAGVPSAGTQDRSTAPASEAHAPADAPPAAPTSSTGVSRADAWRRAWGFPGAGGPGSGPAPTAPDDKTDDTTDGDHA